MLEFFFSFSDIQSLATLGSVYKMFPIAKIVFPCQFLVYYLIFILGHPKKVNLTGRDKSCDIEMFE